MKLDSTAAALAAACAFFAATGAAAQEWTGGYVGGHLGYASQDDDSESIQFDKNLDGRFDDTVTTAAGANAFSPGFCSGAPQGNAPGAGCDEDENGADFGVRAGYDWQSGGLVFGGLVELSQADLSDSVGAFSTTPASYTMTRELDWMAAARLRAGVVAGRFLPYVTAGLARAQVSHSFESTNTVNTFTESSDDEASGHQLGLGIETRVAPRFTVGLEYLFTSLEDESHRVRASGPAPATNPFILTNSAGTDFRRSDDKVEFSAVRLTAAWRF